MNMPAENCLLRGAAAGLAATLPMTAVMSLLRRQLPRREQHPLPPVRITREIIKDFGLRRAFTEPQKRKLAWGAHFAYGAGMGAVFGLLPKPATVPQAALAGAAYGLGVWTASYCGWLPAMGIPPSAAQETPRRNALMIAAHLVWGASLGMLAARRR